MEHPEFTIKFLYSTSRQRKAFRDAVKSAAVSTLIKHNKPAGTYYASISYKMMPGDKGIELPGATFRPAHRQRGDPQQAAATDPGQR